MIETEQTEEFYKNEIRKILSEVKESFKDKQKNNYDLLESYEEVRLDFENEKEPVHSVIDVYERAKQLLD